MTRQQWALTEFDQRQEEDKRFPVEPEYGHPDRPAFNQMKRNRARRRKAMGYSRATAAALVEWAAQMVAA